MQGKKYSVDQAPPVPQRQSRDLEVRIRVYCTKFGTGEGEVVRMGGDLENKRLARGKTVGGCKLNGCISFLYVGENQISL